MSPFPFVLVLLGCVQLQTAAPASYNFPLIEETLEVIAKDAVRGVTKTINDGGVFKINLLNATVARGDEDSVVLQIKTDSSDGGVNKTGLGATAIKYVNLDKGEDYAKDVAYAAINVVANKLIKALSNINIFD